MLQNALSLLGAENIAVPELNREYLERGHAVHFRCHADEVEGLPIDIMSKLRGTDEFDSLWLRRTTILVDGGEIDLLSLPDLVKAKKTQRDKDWPMIRRLVEQIYLIDPAERTDTQVEFLFLELRSPNCC